MPSALISLVVALGSLTYNTWRNERTEHNRNVRTAAFELLTKLAELERVVFLAQYDRDVCRGQSTHRLDVRAGDWRPVRRWCRRRCRRKRRSCRGPGAGNWEGLGKDDGTAVDQIDDAIKKSCARPTLGHAAITALRGRRARNSRDSLPSSLKTNQALEFQAESPPGS